MREGLRGSAAIVGVGTAGVGEAPGRTALELLAEAASTALKDAGLSMTEVDGLFCNTSVHSHPALSIGEYLGIKPTFSESSSIGGSSFVTYATMAAVALKLGLCKVALICYGSNQRSSIGRLAAKGRSQDYESAYQPRHPMSSFALATARHMYQYGTTREQLANVATSARSWASLNPEAFVRAPLTVDDVLSSRVVSDPITVLDCCLVTDGAGAVVMVSSDRANDFPKKPIWFLGGGTAHSHMQIDQLEDITVTAARESGKRAFEMAGLKPADIDILQVYDAATINVILALEDLGFCEKGEGGRFVMDGRIAPGGTLPVNTNGGGLSFCHPGQYGIFTLIEATRQLRGEAGSRQVRNVSTALCHGNGGRLASQATAILGNSL
jgi:acetyl-CoA acetyltransferase